MPLTEKKKSPWGIIIGGIILVGILVIAFCDFTPTQEAKEIVIQHTID